MANARNRPHPAIQYFAGPDWSNSDKTEAHTLEEAEQGDWRILEEQNCRALWKDCIQYANCTPWDIVGEKPDNDSIWPRGFPGAHALNIAVAIQYAVILRTNDRRPWDPAPASADSLYSMMRELTEADGPMWQRHRKGRELSAEQPINLSPMSLVFRALETEVITSRGSFDISHDGMYEVKTQDLKSIIKALDNIVTPRVGISGFFTTSVQHLATLAARTTEPSPSAQELPAFHEVVMVEERRRRIRRLRQDVAGGVSVSDPFAHSAGNSPVPSERTF
ncbi:hypothetical protein ISF_08221 [Cordyceps fumosorosea ARSEF 2679]|uniref:Uncharacterized protein n=1 Tax=Cordyceps fumosorosea (strain ARSEF 2679) TaxID=1081104 RepID=A0A162MDH1_CORFA|nr:hypothetical protein ISF_08221 [Cordyceps fumosorosea ARSEF 2679]OAA54620.1 hypothetical protein ISF_08221 [Cordyceps fumosorosea ARSEF 2679]